VVKEEMLLAFVMRGPTTSCHFPPFGPHDNDPSKAGETVGIEVRTSTHVNICFSMLSLREKRDSL
ncbi:MAG: hypothetical protein DMF14_01625, partial [Verrucomicrobia bacterium]